MTTQEYILLEDKSAPFKGGIIAYLHMKIPIGECFYCEYGKYRVCEITSKFIIAERIYSEYVLRKFSDDKKRIFDIINKSDIKNEDWQTYLHEVSNDLYSLTNK